MATIVRLDEGRELRRERREARIARKHERRRARQLKLVVQSVAPAVVPVRASATVRMLREPAPESTVPSRVDADGRRAQEPSPAVAVAEWAKPPAAPQGEVRLEEVEAPKANGAAGRDGESRRRRRKREIAAFLERREQTLEFARAEANARSPAALKLLAGLTADQRQAVVHGH
jgi:hypothetical protein